MFDLKLFIIAVFLPLFPFSMLFVALFKQLANPLVRAILLLWPLVGLSLLQPLGLQSFPDWLLIWALLTSLLYAIRLLTMRDMQRWVSYLAVSAWSLIWIPLLNTTTAFAWPDVSLYALSFSLPLIFMVLLLSLLQQRFGAAYSGLYQGLALAMPRYSGILTFVLLAATATPIFPAFFVMLSMAHMLDLALAVIMLTSWLLWAWASARLIQTTLVGSPNFSAKADLSLGLTWLSAVGLMVLALFGLLVTGDLL